MVHHSDREPDGQGISTAGRRPIGRIVEIDLNVTERTGDFACACLVPTPATGVGETSLREVPPW